MNRNSTVILYGSYGYTGRLIAEECKSRGRQVILAGRNRAALEAQSKETGYPFVVVHLADTRGLREVLRGGRVVIHCGGPFLLTAKPMVEACLQTGTHYTDIAGEYQVFEMLAGYHDLAVESGIMILPGTGFDVVPSDCLAVYLKGRLPTASNLQLAFSMSKGGLSRGTARTAIEGMGYGSVVRQGGNLVPVPLGKNLLSIDFGPFTRTCMNIPWGDLSTAWRSTAIPNIEVFMGASRTMIRTAQWSAPFAWILRRRWAKEYLRRRIDAGPAGPSASKRETGRSFLWGKVWDDEGRQCAATLQVPSGYTLTAQASVRVAEKILDGHYVPGYQTPATAYGPELILELDRTVRVDR
jgi:short subunit dehydrogenase-like uncharacterized protein